MTTAELNAKKFYATLLSDPEVRNRVDTADKCLELIDAMEHEIPHDELPTCYDWLSAKYHGLLRRQHA